MIKILKEEISINDFVEIECDEVSDGEVIVEFIGLDGVSFKSEELIDNNILSIFIKPGMNGQSYKVRLNKNGVTSNEVILKVNKDIKNKKFSYKDKIFYVKIYDDVYENKLYLCLDDFKNAFNGTKKEFSFERLGNNKIIVNGKERRYFTTIVNNQGNAYCYCYSTDVMMMLDITIRMKNDEYNVFDEFTIDIEELKRNKYFSYLHGCIVGDVDSGKIYYQENENNVCAIASTSKLLTLLLVREKIEEKVLDYDSLIEIGEKSQREALSEDGVVYLECGKKIPLYDMLDCLMLPSSNESAIALGEAISGSEGNFARLMNEKCDELGLTNAHFYNASGLPAYNYSVMPSKLQNRMTAKEMFKLASFIVSKYPDLTNITSKKSAYIKSLDVTINNTNPLLFNMDDCYGLKTGTTNRAGCCLVSYCKYKNHRLVSVVFGAESSQERGEKSFALMKYAKEMVDKLK